MQLRYDEDLVELAVHVCAGRTGPGVPPAQVARFHREREKLYAILDPDERNAAFFKLHLEWFREWNLERALTDLLGEFPGLNEPLAALAFRKARGRHEEGAELYVNSEIGRTAVVALRAERFARLAELAAFLRHEFMHLHDMLDAAFGYSPEIFQPGQNAAQLRLTRERYRLLWDIAIDGRLSAAADVRRRSSCTQPPEVPPPHVGGYAPGNRGQHRAIFDRAFGFWPDARRDEVFASLWNGAQPRHAELLAIASDPRGLKSSHEPTPGAPCPLCGFATYDWADTLNLREQTAEAIRNEFPAWTPDQGACGRCVEIYRLVGAQSPATV